MDSARSSFGRRQSCQPIIRHLRTDYGCRIEPWQSCRLEPLPRRRAMMKRLGPCSARASDRKKADACTSLCRGIAWSAHDIGAGCIPNAPCARVAGRHVWPCSESSLTP